MSIKSFLKGVYASLHDCDNTPSRGVSRRLAVIRKNYEGSKDTFKQTDQVLKDLLKKVSAFKNYGDVEGYITIKLHAIKEIERVAEKLGKLYGL